MDAENLPSDGHSGYVEVALAHSMLCNFSYWCMTKVITKLMFASATTSMSNRPSIFGCEAINFVTVTEIPVQLEPMQ